MLDPTTSLPPQGTTESQLLCCREMDSPPPGLRQNFVRNRWIPVSDTDLSTWSLGTVRNDMSMSFENLKGWCHKPPSQVACCSLTCIIFYRCSIRPVYGAQHPPRIDKPSERNEPSSPTKRNMQQRDSFQDFQVLISGSLFSHAASSEQSGLCESHCRGPCCRHGQVPSPNPDPKFCPPVNKTLRKLLMQRGIDDD